MKTLKVLLQEVVSGIKAWVNSNFAQESNAVHKTGDETVNGDKTFNDNVYTFSAFRQKVSGITDKNAPSSDVSAGTVVVAGNDGTYWGGLTHQWAADGDSTTVLSVGNWREVNNAWSQGYWECRLTASKDFSTKSFYPSGNGAINLGTTSNQWKSVYAQTYYYNGTAWGLDKANTWTGTQIIEQSTLAQFKLKNSTMSLGGAVPSSLKTVGSVAFSDSNNSNFGFMDFRDSALGNTFIRILARQKYDANGNRSPSGTTYESGIDIGVSNDKTPYVSPVYNATTQLGSTNNKWKTFNGINPGALSLPSSHYVEIGTNGWDLSGATYNRVYINNANPTFPGILFIRINSTTLPSIIVKLFSTSGSEITYSGNKMEAVNNNMIITVPCPPSTNIYVSINTSSSISTCRYYTLLGDPEFDSRSGS